MQQELKNRFPEIDILARSRVRNILKEKLNYSYKKLYCINQLKNCQKTKAYLFYFLQNLIDYIPAKYIVISIDEIGPNKSLIYEY